MSRVSAHHFDDLHPAVRSGRRARSFDDFGDVSERGVEAERVVSAREIFVDRLRHADDRHSFLRERSSDAKRIFPAADNERIDFQSLDILDYFMRSVLRFAFLVQLV